MALAQKQKTNTEAATQAITQVQSLTLVKNLLRTSFSSIAFTRNILPPDCFLETRVSGVAVKKLVPSSNEDAKLLCEWLESGIFDALTKKYLETVILEIYEAAKDTFKKHGRLLESYTFSVSYQDGDRHSVSISHTGKKAPSKSNFTSRDDLKLQTNNLLRTIMELTKSLDALPEVRVVSARLLYTEDTPEDYEPPYFKAATQEEKENVWFEDKPLSLKCGSIVSPFHTIALSIRSTPNRFNTAKKNTSRGNNRTDSSDTDNILDVEKSNPSSNAYGKTISKLDKMDLSADRNDFEKENLVSKSFDNENGGLVTDASRTTPVIRKSVKKMITQPDALQYNNASQETLNNKKRKTSTIEEPMDQRPKRSRRAPERLCDSVLE